MQKEKYYTETRFSADVLRDAATAIHSKAPDVKDASTFTMSKFKVSNDDADWTYDDAEEFFADYRRFPRKAYFAVLDGSFDLDVHVYQRQTIVSVKAPTRPAIEAVFDVFERNLDVSRLPPLPADEKLAIEPVVFIGHGRSVLWRDLKDHLQDKHNIKVVAYETGARAGHTIRDVLEELVRGSSFALLVLTGEDEQADGTFHARQNVIHETGLFQGRLGFPRAIMLLEGGTEDFSNVHGIQQICFSKGNIKETFGEVVATFRREFG